MSDIKEQAKEQIEKLKQVDWRTKGDDAKAKVKELVSKENIDKAKNSVKDGIESLKTAEGRQNVKNAAVAGVIAAKNKVVATWNSGPKGKAICVGAVVAFLAIGVLPENEDEVAAVNGYAKTAQSSSPISGLAGYKLGDVYSGPLNKPAELFGPDWYDAPAKAPFLKFTDVSVQVTPTTHRIASIMVMTPDGVSDVTSELETLQSVLEKKFGKMNFEQKTQSCYEWHPGKGNRVIKVSVIQWPMVGNVIALGVYDGDLSSEIKREREMCRQEKANREAEGVDAGL